MSAYAEQEDLDRLKTWWKEYGTSMIVGVLLGAAALAGFRYWTQHMEEQRQIAAGLYERMFQEFHSNQTVNARTTGTTLIQEYSSTPYAEMAGLLIARIDFEAGDATKAREQLQWVIDHADSKAARHAARLRLARIQLDSGNPDAARALLDVKDRVGFEAEYAELLGDIHVTQNRNEAARTAYREAMKYLPPGSPYAPVLNMKLDNLGPEQIS